MKSKNKSEQELKLLLLKKHYADKPMRINEATEFLSLTKSVLHQLVFRNRIPYSKPTGKLLYFSKLDLMNWISNHRIRTGYELE
jgi:excisionase family DNA binding protein